MIYVTCEDPDAAHAKATAAGGEISMELVDQDYGNREFAVRDPEGHTWSFGTYERGLLSNGAKTAGDATSNAGPPVASRVGF